MHLNTIEIQRQVLQGLAVSGCVYAVVVPIQYTYMWKRVWKLKKDLRCIWSRRRHRQLMRRLEKVERRRGPGPAAALGGVGAVWEVWRVEPVIMQSCRVRLSVTVLSWAWRAQDKLKGRKPSLCLFRRPCITLSTPWFSIHPYISAPASLGPGSSLEGGNRPAADFSWDLDWLVLQVCPASYQD